MLLQSKSVNLPWGGDSTLCRLVVFGTACLYHDGLSAFFHRFFRRHCGSSSYRLGWLMPQTASHNMCLRLGWKIQLAGAMFSSGFFRQLYGENQVLLYLYYSYSVICLRTIQCKAVAWKLWCCHSQVFFYNWAHEADVGRRKSYYMSFDEKQFLMSWWGLQKRKHLGNAGE